MEENSLLYKNPNHVGNLNKMRLNNKLCDIIIRVNEVELPAHKVILAASLEYFDTMLSNASFQESKQGIISMENIKAADLEALVSYAYTGEILLTDSNALNLLITADYLSDEHIKDVCSEFLKKQNLKLEDACRAFKFASITDCIWLKNASKTTILSNFEDCSKTTDYLDLDYEHLTEILHHGKRHFTELQKKFFEGIVQWIMHDMKARSVCIDDLFSLIDITKVTADYLLGYLYENMKDYNDECANTRDRIMFYYRTNIIQQRMENEIANAEQALAITGVKNGKLAFQFFNFTEKYWSQLEECLDVDERKTRTGAILDNQLYYTIGESRENSLHVFSSATKESVTLSSSSSILNWSAMSACKGFLYLCGGVNNDGTRSERTLKYDPLTNSFEALSPMRSERYAASAIFYQDYLFVLGGIDCSFKLMNTVERYNPHTKEWTTFLSMCEARYVHAVAVLDEKLYVCGGMDKNSVEVYDPLKNRWQLIASMNEKRKDFIVVAHEGKLLAVGGNSFETVEVYDPVADKWQMDHQLSSGLQIRHPTGGLVPCSSLPM